MSPTAGIGSCSLDALLAIHFVQKLLKAQCIGKRRYKNLRLHMIADEDGLAPLQQSSKRNTDRNFLLALHELGRLAAQAWLEKDAGKVGPESSLEIEKTFLAKR